MGLQSLVSFLAHSPTCRPTALRVKGSPAPESTPWDSERNPRKPGPCLSLAGSGLRMQTWTSRLHPQLLPWTQAASPTPLPEPPDPPRRSWSRPHCPHSRRASTSPRGVTSSASHCAARGHLSCSACGAASGHEAKGANVGSGGHSSREGEGDGREMGSAAHSEGAVTGREGAAGGGLWGEACGSLGLRGRKRSFGGGPGER